MSINLVGREFVNTDVTSSVVSMLFGTPTASIEGTTDSTFAIFASTGSRGITELPTSPQTDVRVFQNSVTRRWISLQNLLNHSEAFDVPAGSGGWGTTSQTTITPNVAADPFGGNAVDAISNTIDPSGIPVTVEAQQNFLVDANKFYNISLHAKQPDIPDNATHLSVRINGIGISHQCVFDLRDGGAQRVQSTTPNAFNLFTELVDGLYRCSFAFDSGSNVVVTVRYRVAVDNSTNDSVPSDVPHTLHIFGAQATQFAIPKSYQQTGATLTSFNATVVGTSDNINKDITASTAAMNLTGNNAIIGSMIFPDWDYPRIGTIRIGSRAYTEDNSVGASERANIALCDVVHLGMFVDGAWDIGTTGYLTRSQVYADLKARNPDLLIFDYTDLMETDVDGNNAPTLFTESGPPDANLYWQAEADEQPYNNLGDPVSDWWGRKGNGDKVNTFGDSFNTNITDYVVPDAQGRRFPEVYADYVQTNFIDKSGGNLDGIFNDVMLRGPKSDSADWNGDGTGDESRSNYDPFNATHVANQGGQSVTSAGKWRAGQRDYLAQLTTDNPGLLISGEHQGWSRWYDSTDPADQPQIFPEYENLVHGSHLNNMSKEQGGFPHSGVTNTGITHIPLGGWSWQHAQNAYTYQMDFNIYPRLVLYDWHVYCTPSVSNSPEGRALRTQYPDDTGTPFNLVRWALCSALMEDGFINIAAHASPSTTNHFSGTPQFDEYGTAGTATTGLSKGWLGQPIDPVQRLPYSGTLYKREFDNGLAIFNSEHDDTQPAQTVDINDIGGAGIWKRINGAQDPTTNDGSTVSANFTIDPIDGIVLERIAPLVAGPDFPRLANGRIGTRSYGDNYQGSGVNFEKNQTEIDNMAEAHFSIINGQPTRGQGYKDAISDCVVSTKAINPAHKVYQYDIHQESSTSLTGDKHDMMVAEAGPPGQLIAGGSPVGDSWYARDGDGNLEEVYPGSYATNITTYCVPNTDTAEDRYWGEKYIDDVFPDNYINGFSTLPDGFYIDVMDHRPREDGLNYSGLGEHPHPDINDNRDRARTDWDDNVSWGGRGYAVASAYRDGHRRGIDRMRAAYPSMLYSANCTTWPREYTGTDPTYPLNEDGDVGTYKEYDGLLDGAWLEGQSNNPSPIQSGFCGMQSDGALHAFGTPRMSMNNYMYMMRHTIGVKHVMNQWCVDVSSVPSDRNHIVGTHITSAAMAVQRFATCQTLLDDGYVFAGVIPPSKDDPYDATPIWDEHGTANKATTGLDREWLGKPLEDALRIKEDAAGTAVPWIAAPEIYKREFQNGLVLSRWDKPGGSTGDPISGDYNIPVVNGGSLANGEIPSGVFKLIDGVQDSAVNTGQVINTTNFPSGYPLRRMDGRVLQRV